ncbi:unnamed protein product [Albugo candida]|uniref:Cilia-and flagella-associated protein 96 n=1 Tax=Albugo candida TaxID=65357 RepID=A0A024GGU8_9STRA|nr:unnamed protein product [Albugo candida]|eukprot:CCI45979.1 unnamed protein product [Albugo candida]
MTEKEVKISRDGGFSDPSFISVGDPYNKRAKAPQRSTESAQKPFVTSTSKAQTGFGPFHRLEGTYSEVYKVEAKVRNANTQKFLKPNGFVYSSPAKKHTGAGDQFGTFQNYETISSPTNARCSSKKPEAEVKRNIFTAPSKRGTFGYAGTLIGGVNQEAWPADYGSEYRHAKKDVERHQKIVKDKKAFKAASAAVDCFDAHEHASASKVFSWDDQCLIKAPDASELLNPKDRAITKANQFRAWRPTDNPKQGKLGAFAKFPESHPDTYDEKAVSRAILPLRRNPVSFASKDIPAGLKDRKAFKPSSGPKSKLTPGICLAGISKNRV